MQRPSRQNIAITLATNRQSTKKFRIQGIKLPINICIQPNLRIKPQNCTLNYRVEWHDKTNDGYQIAAKRKGPLRKKIVGMSWKTGNAEQRRKNGLGSVTNKKWATQAVMIKSIARGISQIIG